MNSEQTENISVGENIKNFRIWRDVTQQALADHLQKSKSVISNWEHGTTSPDVDSCKGICEFLNVSPNELFGWERNREYDKYIKDQKEYQEEIESLRNQAAELNKQIKKLEQQKDDKIPRPERKMFQIFNTPPNELPFN